MDPVDVARALTGFDAAETMLKIFSNTFTTREKLVNEKKVHRSWGSLEGYEAVLRHHVVACSTKIENTASFGTVPENVFNFWDWAGILSYVYSSVAALPLSRMYGYDVFD